MSRRKTTEPVTVTSVHPDVWTDALRQAGGDARRIEIISQTSVVVHNRADWRSAKVTASEHKAKVSAKAVTRPVLAPAVSAPETPEPPTRVEPATPIPAASFVAPQLRSDR